jgi:hypothetical protein
MHAQRALEVEDRRARGVDPLLVLLLVVEAALPGVSGGAKGHQSAALVVIGKSSNARRLEATSVDAVRDA